MKWVFLLALGVAPAWASAQAPPPGQLPPLLLTQLDERGPAGDLDNRTLTLSIAQPIAVKDLLLLIVRGTSLSIVPDPALSGSFIGELRNVTVRQALELVLAPLGFDHGADGGLVRVFPRARTTRIFDLNYIATDRTGTSSIGGAVGATGTAASATVTSATRTDVFTDLARGVQSLLSEGATFNVDRKAGLLQATDFPERLDRVAEYLDAVQDRVHRQVEIDARVIEVELTNGSAQSLDWDALALAASGAPGNQPAGPRAGRAALRVTDVAAFMGALAAQGTISVVANPRLLTLNNEPAIVRTVATEAPGREGPNPAPADGWVLSVTPQISSDGIVMLSLSPIVSSRVPSDNQAIGRRVTHEADTLARVAGGETLVVSGFMRERASAARSGWFGRNTPATPARVAVLILLTPRIVPQ